MAGHWLENRLFLRPSVQNGTASCMMLYLSYSRETGYFNININIDTHRTQNNVHWGITKLNVPNILKIYQRFPRTSSSPSYLFDKNGSLIISGNEGRVIQHSITWLLKTIKERMNKVDKYHGCWFKNIKEEGQVDAAQIGANVFTLSVFLYPKTRPLMQIIKLPT